MSTSDLTLRQLRRRWKPHKTRLGLSDPEHPTNVRFHRACSWLQHSESIAPEQRREVALLSLWFAFNALYGQWDGEQQQPVGDIQCWKHMLERLLDLDDAGHIVDVLTTNRRLVMTIFEDKYLSKFFWQNPTKAKEQNSRRRNYGAHSWYAEKRWLQILEYLVERIYLLRCQLVHGAATFGSSYNRTAVRRCETMMDHLLRVFLLVWIEKGADEDWGIMCYPPLKL